MTANIPKTPIVMPPFTPTADNEQSLHKQIFRRIAISAL
jgi:hypothetical protein